MRVGYLPDMFGHIAQMPQLLSLFDLHDAVVWRGVPTALQAPAFRWRSPDGSEVRAEYLPSGYFNGSNMPDDADELATRVELFTAMQQPFVGDQVLWMAGMDHEVPPPHLAADGRRAGSALDRRRRLGPGRIARRAPGDGACPRRRAPGHRRRAAIGSAGQPADGRRVEPGGRQGGRSGGRAASRASGRAPRHAVADRPSMGTAARGRLAGGHPQRRARLDLRLQPRRGGRRRAAPLRRVDPHRDRDRGPGGRRCSTTDACARHLPAQSHCDRSRRRRRADPARDRGTHSRRAGPRAASGGRGAPPQRGRGRADGRRPRDADGATADPGGPTGRGRRRHARGAPAAGARRHDDRARGRAGSHRPTLRRGPRPGGGHRAAPHLAEPARARTGRGRSRVRLGARTTRRSPLDRQPLGCARSDQRTRRTRCRPRRRHLVPGRAVRVRAARRWRRRRGHLQLVPAGARHRGGPPGACRRRADRDRTGARHDRDRLRAAAARAWWRRPRRPLDAHRFHRATGAHHARTACRRGLRPR